MPTAYMLYNVTVAKEDRAPLGSDLSALATPNGIGRGISGYGGLRPDECCLVLYNMPEAIMR